jgi:hypothetical protein
MVVVFEARTDIDMILKGARQTNLVEESSHNINCARDITGANKYPTAVMTRHVEDIDKLAELGDLNVSELVSIFPTRN